jgi:hypothetical protein
LGGTNIRVLFRDGATFAHMGHCIAVLLPIVLEAFGVLAASTAAEVLIRISIRLVVGTATDIVMSPMPRRLIRATRVR